MRPHRVKSSLIVFFAVLALGVAQPAPGQSFDFQQGRVPLAALDGPWRFHTGDDPAWANAAFDDSHWSLLRADQSWAEQGYKGYGGLAWYRMQVNLPAEHKPLALYLSGVVDSCEVFANGHLIGRIGELPPNQKTVTIRQLAIPIPDSVLIAGQPLLLAIRVWQWPVEAQHRGGGIYAPRLGDLTTISEWSRLERSESHWMSASGIVELYGNILTALAGLALFAMRRKEREYLWWGVSQLLWAVFGAIGLYSGFRPLGEFAFYTVFISLFTFAEFFQIEFIVAFARQRRGFAYWAAIFFILLITFANLRALFLATPLFGSLYSFAMAGLAACQIVLLYLGAKRGIVDARILLVPYSMSFCIAALRLPAEIPFLTASPWSVAIARFFQAPIDWLFGFNASQIVGAFEMYAVLVVMVRRYARAREDEERMEAELEAARTVQRVLVPEEIPAVPGFAVQTVYKPASQVGGDFFQIIPLDSGGALIAIGDVSGKGLPAAMTVSLLVGTFRTLAHYTRNPSEILSAMNQRMLARSRGGFTTCLVLHLEAQGTMTLANAGHLPPYLQGRELDVESGLPLGLAAGTTYVESTYSLAADQQLTLVTDGVVEARDDAGALFGFERTAAITGDSAASIAQAAQDFGQEDDITVLTITRLTSSKGTSVEMTSPELSPSLA